MNLNLEIRKLRGEWLLVAAVAVLLLLFMSITIHFVYRGIAVVLYTAVVGSLMAYQLLHLYRNLRTNHTPQDEENLYPSLGAANWLTMVRAFFLALLAGFIFLPRSTGWLAWAPGALYLTAAMMDFLDGSVARLTKHSTLLGEILDMKWDGFGVLAAATLLVLYGQVPVWYLLVGLARYLFLFGIWLRHRRGYPVNDLPPNVYRRALAGAQMGFIGIVLLPVFTPPATWVGAALFALPLLVGFLRDWLFVCGALDPSGNHRMADTLLRSWGPGVLRILLIFFLGLVVFEQLGGGSLAPGLLMVVVLAVVGLLLGIAGRFFSLLVLLVSGLSLQILPLDWRIWALMLLSTAVMTFGTGRYSLWKPEEWLIYHRVGDQVSPR